MRFATGYLFSIIGFATSLIHVGALSKAQSEPLRLGPPEDGSYLGYMQETGDEIYSGKLTRVSDELQRLIRRVRPNLCTALDSGRYLDYPLVGDCEFTTYTSNDGRVVFSLQFDDAMSGKGHRIGLDGGGVDEFYVPKLVFNDNGYRVLCGRFVLRRVRDFDTYSYSIIVGVPRTGTEIMYKSASNDKC